MNTKEIKRATIGRLPQYLRYISSLPQEITTVSATGIAKALDLGEVQVRKDLALVSDGGRPKVGYNRKALIDDIEQFFGYDYTNTAVIVGSGKLGTPTLNQNYPAAALQPCAGVYLTRIYLDGQWRPAATGIGKRPTVDSSENAAVTCETFVPDFSGNVYGQQPVLEFHKYFCPVRKFNSMDELAALIHHAADESKAYFAALNGAK